MTERKQSEEIGEKFEKEFATRSDYFNHRVGLFMDMKEWIVKEAESYASLKLAELRAKMPSEEEIDDEAYEVNQEKDEHGEIVWKYAFDDDQAEAFKMGCRWFRNRMEGGEEKMACDHVWKAYPTPEGVKCVKCGAQYYHPIPPSFPADRTENHDFDFENFKYHTLQARATLYPGKTLEEVEAIVEKLRP